jgi:predicted peptidase
MSGLLLLTATLAWRPVCAAPDIVETAREYLKTGKVTLSQEAELKNYSGSVVAVMAQLKETVPSTIVSGVFTNQHFAKPELSQRHPDDLLHFYVPPADALPKLPGLLIFMHGGGNTTPREFPATFIMSNAQGQNAALRPAVDRAPFITVTPSAPWNEKVSARWNVPEAEEYIADLIEEFVHRFNIDRDRVFLGGHSMGGFGAYHLGQRMNDRIAGGLLVSGSWNLTRWDAFAGTLLFIVHGVNDATAPGTAGADLPMCSTRVPPMSCSTRLACHTFMSSIPVAMRSRTRGSR